MKTKGDENVMSINHSPYKVFMTGAIVSDFLTIIHMMQKWYGRI